MGWKGSETKIPAGMVFRKMFCHQCGAQLKKHRITEVYKEGDAGYSNRILGQPTLGMSEISKSYYIYKCANCGSEISYDDQCDVAKKQKRLEKKILDEND